MTAIQIRPCCQTLKNVKKSRKYFRISDKTDFYPAANNQACLVLTRPPCTLPRASPYRKIIKYLLAKASFHPNDQQYNTVRDFLSTTPLCFAISVISRGQLSENSALAIFRKLDFENLSESRSQPDDPEISYDNRCQVSDVETERMIIFSENTQL